MKIKAKYINWLELLARIPKEKEGPGAFLGPYMEYPTCKDCKYVMQWHVRGRSVHTDFRLEVNDHLVGWTILTPGGIPKPAATIQEAKEVFKEGRASKLKASNKNVGFRAETKCPSNICDEWQYELVEMKDGLVIVKGKPQELEASLENLARQPKVWLTVEGVVKKGEVGATKEHVGVIFIIEKGQVYFGAQKPYFHEYFIRSSEGTLFPKDDWTRIIVRVVNVQVIDPETKKPKPGTELMWRVLIPGNQIPYALERGFKKKWIPPKDYVPVPPEWRKGDKYTEWEEWVKEAWTGKAPKTEKEEQTRSLEQLPFADFKNWNDCIKKIMAEHPDWNIEQARKYCEAIKAKTEGTSAKFTVHYLSYMGQVVTRGIPNQRWFLRILENGQVHSWASDFDFIRLSLIPLEYEGIIDKKWFDYEGDIPPDTKWNPSKSLIAKMQIVDQGSCIIDTKIEEGAKQLSINFKGKELKGKSILSQEEKESSIYTIEKLLEELTETKFVLQTHEIETSEGLKKHWDIRLDQGFEFNLYTNPLILENEGDQSKALYKVCMEIEKWMAIKEPRTKMMIGDLTTFVTPIDEGVAHIIDYSPPKFISIQFEGKKLKGYFVYLDKEGKGGIFERAKLPHPLSRSGDPARGDFYSPFKEIRKQGWDYFWLEIYDQKAFSRCVDNPEKYLPELSKPAEVLEILVCLYPRPGTIHGARVSRVKFSDKWTSEKAISWIKEQKLHTWVGELIREEHKSTEDEALIKIVEQELAKREKTEEERKVELELKKKKVDLITKWLEENKQ